MADSEGLDRQKAIYEKEKGNTAFKNGKYSDAVDLYSRAIEYDSKQPVLFCNRAMAYLKMKRFMEAKCDCDQALKLDQTYVKAFFRRGLANSAINDLDSALADFGQVLMLEPENKEAKREAEKLEQFISSQPEKALRVESLKHLPVSCHDSVLQQINIQRVGGASAINQNPINANLDHQLNNQDTQCLLQHEITSQDSLKLKHSPPTPASANQNALLQSYVHSATNQKAESEKLLISQKVEVEQQKEDCPSCTVTRKKAAAARLLTQAALDEQRSISAMMTSMLFEPPKSAFQFLNGWRSLKTDRRKFCIYLMKIPPENYVDVVNSCLEPELVTDILSAYSEYGFANVENEGKTVTSTENCRIIFDSLSTLSQLKNFKTSRLFFDAKDIAKLDLIVERLKAHDEISETALDDLKKRFEI